MEGLDSQNVLWIEFSVLSLPRYALMTMFNQTKTTIGINRQCCQHKALFLLRLTNA